VALVTSCLTCSLVETSGRVVVSDLGWLRYIAAFKVYGVVVVVLCVAFRCVGLRVGMVLVVSRYIPRGRVAMSGTIGRGTRKYSILEGRACTFSPRTCGAGTVTVHIVWQES
jgi:hypothetical protein